MLRTKKAFPKVAFSPLSLAALPPLNFVVSAVFFLPLPTFSAELTQRLTTVAVGFGVWFRLSLVPFIFFTCDFTAAETGRRSTRSRRSGAAAPATPTPAATRSSRRTKKQEAAVEEVPEEEAPQPVVEDVSLKRANDELLIIY